MMGRTFFAAALDSAATWWRIYRRDGVTIGLTSHDRDLWFGGVLHRAAPGMVPSAIRRTADISADSAEITGALAHDAISAEDLATGRFDGARLEMGLVDWDTLERVTIYSGEIGAIWEEAGSFGAELISAKARLNADLVPRTSPTCRAAFCGPGCGLNAARFEHEVQITLLDTEGGRVTWTGGPDTATVANGTLRWIDGPHAGRQMPITRADDGGITLDQPLDPDYGSATRALLREGCDHTFATCANRFANGPNFRGDPFLPGNDLLARYPTGAA